MDVLKSWTGKDRPKDIGDGITRGNLSFRRRRLKVIHAERALTFRGLPLKSGEVEAFDDCRRRGILAEGAEQGIGLHEALIPCPVEKLKCLNNRDFSRSRSADFRANIWSPERGVQSIRNVFVFAIHSLGVL